MGKKSKPQKFEGVRQRGSESFRINYKDADGARHWETLTAKDGVLSGYASTAIESSDGSAEGPNLAAGGELQAGKFPAAGNSRRLS